MCKKLSYLTAIFLVSSFFYSINASAQNTLQFTTYYPSPSGVYSKLRLAPTTLDASDCTATTQGLMYLDQATNRLRSCREYNAWGPMPGVWDWNGDNVFLNATSPEELADTFVGIGTANPTAKLHVVSVSDTPLKVTKTTPGGNIAEFIGGSVLISRTDNAQAQFRLYSKYNTTTSSVLVYNQAQTKTFGLMREEVGNNAWPFKIKTDAPSNSFNIADSGYIGLGTSTPSGRIHLLEQDGALNLEGDNSANANPIFSINFLNTDQSPYTTTPYTAARIVSYNQGNTNDGNLLFYTTQNGANLEKMRITEDGLVGIGTSDPQGLLDITHNSNLGAANEFLLNVNNSNLLARFQGPKNSISYAGTIDLVNIYGAPRINMYVSSDVPVQAGPANWSLGPKAQSIDLFNFVISHEDNDVLLITPEGVLETETIKITGGDPQPNKILTATDDEGNAEWQDKMPDARNIRSNHRVTEMTPNKTYLVSVYGLTANRGNDTERLSPIGVRACNGVEILARSASGGIYINWPDGEVPYSATFVITAPSDGCIEGFTDGGDAKHMTVVQLN